MDRLGPVVLIADSDLAEVVLRQLAGESFKPLSRPSRSLGHVTNPGHGVFRRDAPGASL